MDKPGAEEAVADLYAVCCGRLVAMVTLAAGSRSEAEECVQEAFVRLLHHWGKVSHYQDPEAWVRTVAFRLLSDRRRKTRHGIKALLRSQRPTPSPGPTGDRVDVMRALAHLPLAQRQVVVLHHLSGLSVGEVAAALGVSPGTVKSRLSRGREALAPLLHEETVRD
ncbi:MAG: polymerase, sigma-24 subunit, subfamily [Frankiales bacterium]|nr:polymerase, sigma-24 subunit, subfamily [Frankiales bacterium]